MLFLVGFIALVSSTITSGSKLDRGPRIIGRDVSGTGDQQLATLQENRRGKLVRRGSSRSGSGGSPSKADPSTPISKQGSSSSNASGSPPRSHRSNTPPSLGNSNIGSPQNRRTPSPRRNRPPSSQDSRPPSPGNSNISSDGPPGPRVNPPPVEFSRPASPGISPPRERPRPRITASWPGRARLQSSTKGQQNTLSIPSSGERPQSHQERQDTSSPRDGSRPRIVVPGGAQLQTSPQEAVASSSRGSQSAQEQLQTSPRTPVGQRINPAGQGSPFASKQAQQGPPIQKTPKKKFTPLSNESFRGQRSPEPVRPENFRPMSSQLAGWQGSRMTPERFRPPAERTGRTEAGSSKTGSSRRPVEKSPVLTSEIQPDPQPLGGTQPKRGSTSQPTVPTSQINPKNTASTAVTTQTVAGNEKQKTGTTTQNTDAVVHKPATITSGGSGRPWQRKIGLAAAWADEHKALSYAACATLTGGCMALGGTPAIVYGGHIAAVKAVGVGMAAGGALMASGSAATGTVVAMNEFQKKQGLSEEEMFKRYEKWKKDNVDPMVRAASFDSLGRRKKKGSADSLAAMGSRQSSMEMASPRAPSMSRMTRPPSFQDMGNVSGRRSFEQTRRQGSLEGTDLTDQVIDEERTWGDNTGNRS